MNAINTSIANASESEISNLKSQILNPLLVYWDSLSSIAHLIDLPNPPPTLGDLRKLLDQRIADLEADANQLDPSSPTYTDDRQTYLTNRALLWQKIVHLNEAYRQAVGLNLPTEFPADAVSPFGVRASAREISLSQKDTIKPETPETRETSSQIPARNSDELSQTPSNEPLPTKTISSTIRFNSIQTDSNSIQTDPNSSQTDSYSITIDPAPIPAEPAQPAQPEPKATTALILKPIHDIEPEPDFTDDYIHDAYLDLRQRRRGRKSPLDQLSEAKQKDLFEMLQEHPAAAVHAVIVNPEPVGYGIQTSIPSLNRFRKKYAADLDRRRTAHRKTSAHKVITSDNHEPVFRTVFERALQYELLAMDLRDEKNHPKAARLVNTFVKIHKAFRRRS